MDASITKGGDILLGQSVSFGVRNIGYKNTICVRCKGVSFAKALGLPLLYLQPKVSRFIKGPDRKIETFAVVPTAIRCMRRNASYCWKLTVTRGGPYL